MDTPVTIVALDTIERYRECESLQMLIWGAEPIEVTPADVLVTAHRHGGLVLGALDSRGNLVGFLFGFPGTPSADNPSTQGPGRIQHCSHALGVMPGWQGRGVGYRLKIAQRDWLLSQGIDIATWTYDPLEFGNAVLNIGKLGGVCRCYLRNLYGIMPDRLNGGIPSDRFEVVWRVKSERVQRRVEAGWLQKPLAAILDAGGTLLNPARLRNGIVEPGETGTAFSDRVIVEIPTSYQAVKLASADLALSWRLHVREIMEGLFAGGYEVCDCLSVVGGEAKRAYYLLASSEMQKRGRD